VEKLGYFISEAPVLILIIWFAYRLVQFRRYRKSQPIVTEGDRQLFCPKQRAGLSFRFFHKLAVATAITGLSAYLEVIILAPLGAAILTVTVLLTSATVVHRLLFSQA